MEITVSGTLAQQLQAIALREQRPLEEILEAMVELYQHNISQSPAAETVSHPLDAILGIYDDDIVDLSTTVRETMDAHFKATDDDPA